MRTFTILFFVHQALAPGWQPRCHSSLETFDRQTTKAQQARNYAQKTPSRQASGQTGHQTPNGRRLNVGPSASFGPACPFDARDVRVARHSNECAGSRLANKVNACTLDRGRITVVAESSAWAARIRFGWPSTRRCCGEKTPDYRGIQRPRPAATGPLRAYLRPLRSRRSRAGRRRSSPPARTAPCR